MILPTQWCESRQITSINARYYVAQMVWYLFAVSALTTALAAKPFSIVTVGPKNVYTGSTARFSLRPVYPADNTSKGHLYINSVTLPAGWSWSVSCRYVPCKNNNSGGRWYLWEGSSTVFFALDIVVNAPPQTSHVVTVELERDRVKETVTLPINVMAIEDVKSAWTMPPVLDHSQYDQTMLKLAAQYCELTKTYNFGYEGDAWYYDGGWVYEQIAAYTGDPYWKNCGYHILNQYRDHVIERNGQVQGWRLFPHGLKLAYDHTNDERYKNAVVLMARNSPFALQAGGVSDQLIRETAYVLNVYVAAEQMGEPRHSEMARAVDHLLGHFDILFRQENFSIHQVFFDGLALEALIRYYEHTKDPRIPSAVKLALDYLWQKGWDQKAKKLVYSWQPVTLSPVDQSTNMINLVVPAFGWLYHHSGDPLYAMYGDELFRHSLDTDISYSGKIFAQNYRWSMEYLRWRKAQPRSYSPAPLSNDATVTLNSNNAAGVATVTATVALKSLAPARGEFLAISATPSGAVNAPTSITIPAGSSTASFTFQTKAVSAPTAVTIVIASVYSRSSVVLQVNPPTIAPSLPQLLGVYAPATQFGGAGAQVTVVLSGPAPAAGALIQVEVPYPQFISAPTAVTVPAGSSRTTFNVVSQPVTENLPSTITTKYNGTTKTAAITFTPPVVRNIYPVIKSGAKTTNNVMILSVAAAPDTEILLQSSSPVLQVPASITATAGSDRVLFSLTAAPVTSAVTAVLSATCGGVTKTVSVTINP